MRTRAAARRCRGRRRGRAVPRAVQRRAGAGSPRHRRHVRLRERRRLLARRLLRHIQPALRLRRLQHPLSSCRSRRRLARRRGRVHELGPLLVAARRRRRPRGHSRRVHGSLAPGAAVGHARRRELQRARRPGLRATARADAALQQARAGPRARRHLRRRRHQLGRRRRRWQHLPLAQGLPGHAGAVRCALRAAPSLRGQRHGALQRQRDLEPLGRERLEAWRQPPVD